MLAQSGCTTIKAVQRDDYVPFEINPRESRRVVGVILLSGETVMFEELVFDWESRPILGATTDSLVVRVKREVSGPPEVRAIPLSEIEAFLVRLPDTETTIAYGLLTALYVGSLALGLLFFAKATYRGGI
jgi:hypothetical protein